MSTLLTALGAETEEEGLKIVDALKQPSFSLMVVVDKGIVRVFPSVPMPANVVTDVLMEGVKAVLATAATHKPE